MELVGKYIEYITSVRRYSSRTRAIYSDALTRFCDFASGHDQGHFSDKDLKESLTPSIIRGYEMELLDKKRLDPRTVNLHISVLSSFCRFLVKKGELKSNPVRTVSRPKVEKRLPVFYKKDDMDAYFSRSGIFAMENSCTSPDEFIGLYLSMHTAPGYRPENDPAYSEMENLRAKPDRFSAWLFTRRLDRLIISILYSTGIRRSELVSLKRGNIDFSRRIMKVRGKGDKTREIPLVPSLCKEISLY